MGISICDHEACGKVAMVLITIGTTGDFEVGKKNVVVGVVLGRTGRLFFFFFVTWIFLVSSC